VQDSAVFERFVRIQDENQTGRARIAWIVSRETSRKFQEFYGLGRYFSLFLCRESCPQGPQAQEEIVRVNERRPKEVIRDRGYTMQKLNSCPNYSPKLKFMFLT
jgi:hypothetical protein